MRGTSKRRGTFRFGLVHESAWPEIQGENRRRVPEVADLSIQFSRDYMRRSMAGVLQVSDNTSALARFNDEKVWVEYVLTRVIPSTNSESVNSDPWAYERCS